MKHRHLKYFAAVAEARSFTRASEELRVAQPALSVQVRQLEVSREGFVVALPAGHPLAAKESVAVADLALEPFVLPARHGMPEV